MNRLTIGQRILLGFVGLIFITGAVGGVAVLNLRRTEAETRQLAELKVPQVQVANAVERSAHLTLYQMIGYATTERTNYLATGMQQLEETKKCIAEAQNLGARSPLLANLKLSADAAEAKMRAYEQYVQQTEAATQGIQQNRGQVVAATQAFIDNCEAYLADMNEKLAADLQTKAAPEVLLDQLQKISLMTDVMADGNTLRLAVWRAQAQRDFQLLLDAQINFALIKDNLDELRKGNNNPVHAAQLANCQTTADTFQKGMADLLANWQARDLITSNRLAAGTELLQAAQTAAGNGLSDTTAATGRAAKLLSTASFALMLGLAMVLLVGMAVAFFISRGANRILNHVAGELDEASHQVVTYAAQVASSSESSADGASRQAAALQETGASLKDMLNMTQHNAEHSQQSLALVTQAHQAATQGSTDIQAMNAAMEAIKVSSNDIAKIVKTIDEIAFQTNILALNASVEAARAGAAGLGFAVVAEEVRNLAQRSALSAKETAAKIEGAIARTAQGVQLSGRVATALKDVTAQIQRVDGLAAEVAKASSQQTQGITQITSAVDQMDQLTQTNAANAQESAAVARELNTQAALMKQSVAKLLQLVDGQSRPQETAPGRDPQLSRPRAAVAEARRARSFKSGSPPGKAGRSISVPVPG